MNIVVDMKMLSGNPRDAGALETIHIAVGLHGARLDTVYFPNQCLGRRGQEGKWKHDAFDRGLGVWYKAWALIEDACLWIRVE